MTINVKQTESYLIYIRFFLLNQYTLLNFSLVGYRNPEPGFFNLQLLFSYLYYVH
ncbi:hypothetical protein K502DRAFT_326523 [Neoconidiobolus thromboides FSU 785]|nr:hypothetical protein K502DRAFT_326523 [Neoconidiobolus thromboides FSU 785]